MVIGHIMMGEHQATWRAINLYVACCFKQGSNKNKIWKFLNPPFMVFAIKGGLAYHKHFSKLFFFLQKNIKNHSLTANTCFAHSLGFTLYTYSS